jgi:hypothetical protein
MSYLLAPIGNGAQFFTTTGLPLAGGYLYTYLAGTSTPAATYTTSSGSVSNTNPIQLGTDGRPPQEIWLPSGTNYKFVLADSTGSILQTYDNLYGIPTTLTSSNQVPSGCILMWSGSIASIPTGYYLCNGQNGTPNLQDSFVVGAGNTYGVGNNGGFTSSVTSSSGTNLPLYYALAYIQKS